MVNTEADYLEELIAFPSISEDKGASKKCAEHCTKFFKNHGLHTELIESDGYPNVVATSQKTKSPKILLQCHMDVVPADDNLFVMKKSGNKLLGRGVFDMKFACASYMVLLDQLGHSISKYDFGIMLSFDEEIGGKNGVEALLAQGYGAELCILPDSGKNWQLESSANGAWFVKLTTTGKSAHGSMPETGINAAEKLLKKIPSLDELKKQFSSDELTLSLTVLDSGKAINQIPGSAEATFDIRYRNDEVFKRVKSELQRLCKTNDINLETVFLGPCMNTNVHDPGVEAFTKVAEDILGRKINTCHSKGSTDARYFCKKNIPCVVIQPNGGGRHADNEWVDEKGVRQLTDMLHKFITEYAII